MFTAEATRLGIQFLVLRNRPMTALVERAIGAITNNTNPIDVEREGTWDERAERVTFYWESGDEVHRARLTGFVHGALATVDPEARVTEMAVVDVPAGMALDAPMQITSVR